MECQCKCPSKDTIIKFIPKRQLIVNKRDDYRPLVLPIPRGPGIPAETIPGYRPPSFANPNLEAPTSNSIYDVMPQNEQGYMPYYDIDANTRISYGSPMVTTVNYDANSPNNYNPIYQGRVLPRTF